MRQVEISRTSRSTRPNGLIRRRPGSNRYTLTPDGIRITTFHTKVYNRLLVPLTNADQPQAHPNYAPPWPPSVVTSTATPRTRACPTPPLASIMKNLATKDR